MDVVSGGVQIGGMLSSQCEVREWYQEMPTLTKFNDISVRRMTVAVLRRTGTGMLDRRGIVRQMDIVFFEAAGGSMARAREEYGKGRY